jgi:hypothetical protein
MVVVPSSAPVAIPAAETDATVVSDKVHVATLVMLPWLPSEKIPVAVNCWVAPTGKDAVCGVTEIAVTARTFWVRTGDVLPA